MEGRKKEEGVFIEHIKMVFRLQYYFGKMAFNFQPKSPQLK